MNRAHAGQTAVFPTLAVYSSLMFHMLAVCDIPHAVLCASVHVLPSCQLAVLLLSSVSCVYLVCILCMNGRLDTAGVSNPGL